MTPSSSTRWSESRLRSLERRAELVIAATGRFVVWAMSWTSGSTSLPSPARTIAIDPIAAPRGDLVAVGQGGHVLLPPANRQEAVGRQLAEIAGVVPALGVDRGSGGRRIAPVALEPVRTPREDLAVRRDPDLDAGDRLAH